MGTSYSAQPQEGRNIIVTGANSGIGYNTALELGRSGANVIVVARDQGRGEAAVQKMKEAVPEGKFELELCDISSLKSIRDFVDRYKARHQPLDTLINNAGIMMLPTRELSADGFEMQWATNHLGHFALTGLLLPELLQSTSPRVVNVSSLMAWTGRLHRPDFRFDFVLDSGYSPEGVYGDTKLANQLFMRGLAVRYPQLTVTAAHPGGTSTNLQKHRFGGMRWMMQSTANGALPTLRAATEADCGSGAYIAPRFGGFGAATTGWLPARGRDDKASDRLWRASVEATRVDY